MHPFSPLKTWENQSFSDVFRGVEEGCIGNKWVKWSERCVFRCIWITYATQIIISYVNMVMCAAVGCRNENEHYTKMVRYN